MGTPSPKLHEGEKCTVCWTSDQFFGTGPTPEFITAELVAGEKNANWSPGDGEAIAGRFTLTQVDGTPCIYRYDVGGVNLVVGFNLNDTSFQANNPEGKNTYSSLGNPKCSSSGFSNGAVRWDGGSFGLEIPGEAI